MPQVTIKQWKTGLRKVSLATLLQEEAGLSLTSAKQCVDRLLEGQSISVSVTTVEQARQLARQIDDLGAVCEVNNDDVPE